MNKLLEKFSWADKPEIKKEVILVAAILAVVGIGYFKFRSNESSSVVVKSSQVETTKPPTSLLEKLTLTNSRKNAGSEAGTHNSTNQRRPETERSAVGKAIIERPLFDGLEVILKGVLLGEVSSLAPENPAEIQIVSLVPDEATQNLDPSEVLEAKIKGIISTNMAKKRLNITFAEITTKEGRSFSVTGYAVDPESKTLGLAANYSSGLGSRILGVALDRTIVAADQIAMAKIMDGMSDNSQSAKELQRASIETNQQASMSISAEATKDLRETSAELSLPVGTLILMKVRASKGASQ